MELSANEALFDHNFDYGALLSCRSYPQIAKDLESSDGISILEDVYRKLKCEKFEALVPANTKVIGTRI